MPRALYQIILRTVDLDEYYANFFFLKHCALKSGLVDGHGSQGQRWTCSVYINFMHRGGMRDEVFKDGARGAKWPNEELCTFYRRTTLFQSTFRPPETQDVLR